MRGSTSKNALDLIEITGKSIKELASLMGYTPVALSYSLTGKRPMSVRMAVKLSETTGLPYSHFLQYNS
jgi:plasmid maintenance system antidote protein VapI